ncbi:MAG: hypothetical protein QW059_03615 [Nitrososphaerota archaeon]
MGDINALSQRVLEIISSLPNLKIACDRCLRTERWGGSVALMVVDASLTSSGLSYFDLVVPRVRLFSERFVERGLVANLRDLSNLDLSSVMEIFRNERCWRVAREIASVLTCYGQEDREALRSWASQSTLRDWRSDPVGSIKGVGLVTYQYLRMMGGVDTVMPDRVVKRVINRLLAEAGFKPIEKDLEFIQVVSEIGERIGVRPIELCWMTWLVEGEELKIRYIKDPELLLKI